MNFEFDPTKVASAQISDDSFTREKKEQEAGEPVVTMEIEDHPNIRFMKKYKRYEPRIRDSHAMKILKVCPRKYFLEIVLGRIANDKSIVLQWGTAYHKFRERLEVTYGIGPTKPSKFDEGKAIDAFTAAVNYAMEYWKKNYREQAPGTKWEFMTSERLMKSFMVAFQHWKKEKLQGRIEVIAIEQSFNVQLADGSRTSGRADQIVRWNSSLWGRDFKTTSKDTAFFSRQLEPNDQFTRYTLAEGILCGEFIQGQLVELLYNSKPTKSDTKGPAVVELTTSRTKPQLAQFEAEQGIWNKTLELYREHDIWPMNESTCPFCPFHSVCTKPTEGAMMAQLEQHFVVRPWDNTRIGIEED